MSKSGLEKVKARLRSDSGSDETAQCHHVLVVEDERDLQDLLKYNLEREGYRVQCAGSGEQALKLVVEKQPDVVVLDLMLPGVDGLEVCRSIRSNQEVRKIAIVMLTAKGSEADVVAGLEVGADDYMTKPFSPRELVARVRAVLRRVNEGGDLKKGNGKRIVRFGEVTVDPLRHEVLIQDKPINLTVTEFKLLYQLISRAGRVFTRQQIIESVHGPHTVVTDRAVDVQILNLRRKLGDFGSKLVTVRGVGYKFSG